MPPGETLVGPIGRFAAEVLGRVPGTDEAEARAALLRKLLDEDFLPDPLTHEAILALAGRSIDTNSLLAEEAAEAEGRTLHKEVEQFATRFFEEPVASRVDRYRLLGQACAQHPSLIERLRLLRPGLMIDRSANSDPSPLVRALLKDVFDLFVLRPGPRAIEARERAETFRADPNSTEAERARALKQLAKGHPEIVALLPDYPAGLGKVRRRGSADRLVLKSVKQAVEPSNPFQRGYLILAVILLSGVGRFLATKSPTSSTFTPSNYPAAPKILLPAAKSDAAIADAILRFVRNEFKVPIRRELTKVGKSIDDSRLDRIVAQLPVERLPKGGGMSTILLTGQWTEERRKLFVASLKTALKSAELGLSDPEVDNLAPRCFPKATLAGKP